MKLPTGVWLVCFVLIGCGDDAPENTAKEHAAQHDDFKGCPPEVARFEPGLEAEGERFKLKLVEADPQEPERYENDWTVELALLDGSPAPDVEIERGQTFMPSHGHDGRVVPEVMSLERPGQFRVERVNFTMRGVWEVRFWLSSAAAGDDYVVLRVCVAK